MWLVSLLLRALPGPALLWRWGAIAAVLAVGAGYIALKVHAHDTLEQEKKVAAVEAKTERTIAAQKSITKGVADEYETRLAAVRDHFATWVPIGPRGSKVSALSCPSGGTDARSTDAVSAADYGALQLACAETTQQLVSLQEWVRKQQAVK